MPVYLGTNKVAGNIGVSLTQIYSAIFPIGRGFIDFTDTDYSDYLGFVWERELVGMTPVGLDIDDLDFNEIGKTGGEKEHILTIDEMPSHQHNTPGAGNTQFASGGYTLMANTNGSNPARDKNTANAGGGEPHNNMPPYKIVAYWKRVA